MLCSASNHHCCCYQAPPESDCEDWWCWLSLTQRGTWCAITQTHQCMPIRVATGAIGAAVRLAACGGCYCGSIMTVAAANDFKKPREETTCDGCGGHTCKAEL